MPTLKEQLAEQIPALRDAWRTLDKTHGDKIIDKVTVEQAMGGMRGIKGIVCETSEVDPHKGLLIRNIPIIDLADRLPEEIFYLLLMGRLPNADELKSLQSDLHARAAVPQYVWDFIDTMPADSHSMTLFAGTLLVQENDSQFAKKYAEGVGKTDQWLYAYEDGLTLIARAPAIAAYIYRKRFNKGARIAYDASLDWGANYAQMLGVADPNGAFKRLMRLYLTLHSDHEGGNASAFTALTVASTLASPYLAFSAAMNALAGPLHGLANQECLKYTLEMYEHYQRAVPSDEQMTEFAWGELNAKRVIPGYGHAVLRSTDPRYTAFKAFGEKEPDVMQDPIFQIILKGFRIIPDVLTKHGKASSVWPNVDAISGSLLHHYDVKEVDYYTVMFGVSRALGIVAQMILNRAVGAALIRPKSVSTEWLKRQAEKA